MPQRKFRYFSETDDEPQVSARAADGHEGFVASPVHAMHRNLWAFAQSSAETPERLYPGWVRLAVPLIGSGTLWLMIFWVMGYLR